MKVCLAGTGAMGVIHMKALAKIAGVEVVSVNSRTDESGRAFAAQWGIPHHSTRLEASLDRPGVDAVILTTPSSMHADQTVTALDKGKHVQVEIPMSLNLPDAERMVQATRRSGKICMVTHTRRFASPHREIRRRIREGSFHLHHMVVETYFFRRENTNMHGQARSWVDNLLWHHGCHSVDLAQWILGEPDFDVWGQRGPDHPALGIPMDMTVGMKSRKGVLFSLAMSFNNKGPFGGFYRYIGEEDTFKVYRDSMTDGDGQEVPLDQTLAFDRQDVEFTSAICEGREPESSAQSCLPTMALLDGIEKGDAAMIIDCHGHYTTAPKALQLYRDSQIDGLKNPSNVQTKGRIAISDDEIRESLEHAQLKLQRERGTDVTIFSPRASAMAHHLGDATTSLYWSQHCNDLIARVCCLYPRNFVGVCQLPQSPGVPPRSCIGELERCINELGFIGCNLNPDPSGGHWTAPPLTDRSWYPLYEKMVELDVPAMVHVSSSCNPNFHATGAHYINADTTAFMQFLTADLFKDFPTLRFIIPHGGGAVPYHWGRYRGLAQDLKRPPLPDLIRDHVFFDTCVYHLPGIELLVKVVPAANILFGSEMVGAVRGIDPETGHYFDDTKRYIDALTSINDVDKRRIFEGNARRVFPRINDALGGGPVVAPAQVGHRGQVEQVGQAGKA